MQEAILTIVAGRLLARRLLMAKAQQAEYYSIRPRVEDRKEQGMLGLH